MQAMSEAGYTLPPDPPEPRPSRCDACNAWYEVPGVVVRKDERGLWGFCTEHCDYTQRDEGGECDFWEPFFTTSQHKE